MNERYNRLFFFNQALYTEKSPITIEAGALLSDSLTGKYIVQLKMKNISSMIIRSVSVEITLTDINDQPITETVLFVYKNSNNTWRNEFGSKTPIVIPFTNAKSFSVRVSHISYKDPHTSEEKNANYTKCKWEPLPDKININNVLNKEHLELYNSLFGEKAAYQFCQHKDLWMCTCGEYNRNKRKKCLNCGNSIEQLMLFEQSPQLATQDKDSKKINNSDFSIHETKENSANNYNQSKVNKL